MDPTLHSLQLLNLAAVVYDLSFELQRLYLLVSNRPLLMVVILAVALGVEWLLERYEEDDNAATGTHRGTLSGVARIGRSVGRVLLPGVMSVLIACVGWLLLSAVMLHPTALAAPLIQYVDRMVGGASSCASISDCLLITGSSFQHRVHGVYVRTSRECSDKPVYRQRGGGEALYLHSPGHENQWNVGPEACNNSPRNKWMEFYSAAARAEDIGNGSWFEYTDEGGWLKSPRVLVRPCSKQQSRKVARGHDQACVEMRGSSRDDALYLQARAALVLRLCLAYPHMPSHALCMLFAWLSHASRS
tara:strand:- start:879 stop:1787 length:909 start_codon:yes stop_codon:yes gene_type:complete